MPQPTFAFLAFTSGSYEGGDCARYAACQRDASARVESRHLLDQGETNRELVDKGIPQSVLGSGGFGIFARSRAICWINWPRRLIFFRWHDGGEI